MKKNFAFILLIVSLYSCGGNSTGTEDKSAGAQNQGTDNSAAEKTAVANMPAGAQLILKSDCGSCHKDHNKLVGPSYADIAKKYSNTPEIQTELAVKIIKGGSGVWGSVPMSAHPGVSEADAKEMMAYILSLK